MTDPLADHLEMMVGLSTHRREQPYCYATTSEQEQEADALYQALKAAHSQIYVTTVGQIREAK